MCDASPIHPFFDAHTPESPSETDKIDALPIIVRREQSLEMTRETWDYMMRVNPHVSHVPVHLCFVCPTDEEKRFINLDLFSLFDFVVLCKNHKNDVCVRSHVVFYVMKNWLFCANFSLLLEENESEFLHDKENCRRESNDATFVRWLFEWK